MSPDEADDIGEELAWAEDDQFIRWADDLIDQETA